MITVEVFGVTYLSSLGYLDWPLYQRLGKEPFLSWYVPHPMPSSFLVGAQKDFTANKEKPGAQIQSNAVLGSYSLTGICIFWGFLGPWNSSCILCITGQYSSLETCHWYQRRYLGGCLLPNERNLFSFFKYFCTRTSSIGCVVLSHYCVNLQIPEDKWW